MKHNTTQVSAFVLHAKSYQENSQIIQLFSFELGRFSIIAKGIKGKRSQARKAVLQPFNELIIGFTGRGDLKTLVHCEIQRVINSSTDRAETNCNVDSLKGVVGLSGKALACGYYANELILRACPERHEYPELYIHYGEFINQLKSNPFVSNTPVQPILRNFEVALLTNIGIAPDWIFDLEQNEIQANQYYYLIPEMGFQMVETENNCQEPIAEYALNSAQNIEKSSKKSSQKLTNDSFYGQSILSLATGEHYPEYFKSSQQITAVFLREVIGNKPLQSRKMWQHLNLAKDSLSSRN